MQQSTSFDLDSIQLVIEAMGGGGNVTINGVEGGQGREDTTINWWRNATINLFRPRFDSIGNRGDGRRREHNNQRGRRWTRKRRHDNQLVEDATSGSKVDMEDKNEKEDSTITSKHKQARVLPIWKRIVGGPFASFQESVG
jgi:hypothetical protein